MIRTLISTLLQRLTTDTGALRERIATLEQSLVTAEYMRDHHKAEADAFHHLHDSAVDERDRLRAMVGNTGATASEREVLAVVATMPGALAKDIGRQSVVIYREKCRAEWADANPGKEPPTWAYFVGEIHDSDIADAVKPLSGLYKKGLVRREKAGNSYRYWSVA